MIKSCETDVSFENTYLILSFRNTELLKSITYFFVYFSLKTNTLEK